MSVMKRTFVALIVSLVVLILGLLLLKWPIWFVGLIALGLYFAIFYLLTPQFKVGDVIAEHTTLNEELNQLYLNSTVVMAQLEDYPSRLENVQVIQQLNQVRAIGEDILHHLSNNLSDLSSSRHFLEYYLPKTLTVVDNYNKLEDIHLSADKMAKVNDQTVRTLQLLTNIFRQQRDDYYQKTVSQLEVTNELLEKTVAYGSDMIDQEHSSVSE